MAEGSPPPPLSAEDARTILTKLRPELDRSDETGAAVVLIGGQAVLFWQRQLGTEDDPDGIVETSGDIDFAVADREVVEHCAELLGGRARFADPVDTSPNFALILFTDEHGHRRQLDVIAAPLGLRLDDVRLTRSRSRRPAARTIPRDHRCLAG